MPMILIGCPGRAACIAIDRSRCAAALTDIRTGSAKY